MIPPKVGCLTGEQMQPAILWSSKRNMARQEAREERACLYNVRAQFADDASELYDQRALAAVEI